MGLAGFDGVLGLELTEAGPDGVRGRLEVDGRHHQPHGIVHGGVYCTLVETLASHGGAIWAVGEGMAGAVGVANATDFLRPHREGALLGEARPVHRGRRQQLWQVEIRREADGALVARGQLRLHNLVDTGEAVGPAPAR